MGKSCFRLPKVSHFQGTGGPAWPAGGKMKRSEIKVLWLIGIWTILFPFIFGWFRTKIYIFSGSEGLIFFFYFLASGWIVLGLVWLTIRKWRKR